MTIDANLERLRSSTPVPSGDTLAAAARAGDDAKLREVAQEFESLFIKQMLDAMRATLNPDDDLLGGGFAQEVFDDMLYDEYARTMARTGGFGLADMIVDQLAERTVVESPGAAAYDAAQPPVS